MAVINETKAGRIDLHSRGGGRTTRALASAVLEAAAGRDVVYLSHTQMESAAHFDRALDIVRVICGDSIRWSRAAYGQSVIHIASSGGSITFAKSGGIVVAPSDSQWVRDHAANADQDRPSYQAVDAASETEERQAVTPMDELIHNDELGAFTPCFTISVSEHVGVGEAATMRTATVAIPADRITDLGDYGYSPVLQGIVESLLFKLGQNRRR